MKPDSCFYREFLHVHILLRLNEMLYALCLSYHSNKDAVLFACLLSGLATTTGRMLGSNMGNSIKCLSQGHSDALPDQESKKVS